MLVNYYYVIIITLSNILPFQSRMSKAKKRNIIVGATLGVAVSINNLK